MPQEEKGGDKGRGLAALNGTLITCLLFVFTIRQSHYSENKNKRINQIN